MLVLAVVAVEHVEHEVDGDTVVLPEIPQCLRPPSCEHVLCHLGVSAHPEIDLGLWEDVLQDAHERQTDVFQAERACRDLGRPSCRNGAVLVLSFPGNQSSSAKLSDDHSIGSRHRMGGQLVSAVVRIGVQEDAQVHVPRVPDELEQRLRVSVEVSKNSCKGFVTWF